MLVHNTRMFLFSGFIISGPDCINKYQQKLILCRLSMVYIRAVDESLGTEYPGTRVFELQWDYMLIFLPKKHNKSNISANSCIIEDFTCKLYSLTLIDIVEWLFGGIKPFADKDDLINLLWEILK